MTKILRIINRFNVGGPVNNALYLSRYLDSKFETKLIGGIHTEEEISAEFMFQELEVSYELIPEMSRSIKLWSDFVAYRKISKIIKEYQPDIVHTHASKAGLIGRLAAIRHGVPVIIHTFHGHVFHSYFGWLKTRVFITIEQILALKTNAIIAISPLQLQELSQTFKIAPTRKFHLIPLGFNLYPYIQRQDEKREAFRSKYQLKEQEIAICIIGRLVPIKNHALFIEALAELKTTHQLTFRAFVVGDGFLKAELLEQAEKLGLSTSQDTKPADVCFTSWITDTAPVYAGCDIVALSSKNEGTPVTLIEAQAALKPIVSTPAGGTEDILYPSSFHKISLPNPKDFAQNIRDIMVLLQTEKPAEAIRKVCIDRFAYQNLVNKMQMLYTKLLK